MSSVLNWIRSKRNVGLKAHHLYNAYSPPEYMLPVSLTMTNDTLFSMESRSSGSTGTSTASSSLSGFAEPMDDENAAWGPPKSKPKAKKALRK